MWWPFADEQAFWAWANDPDAEIDAQDEDLMLQDPAGLPLLLAAADRPDCVKRDLCAFVLEDYARRIVGWRKVDVYPALRVTAARAASGHDARTRRWAAYVTRLFSYLDQHRPVNRAAAEQMAVDLLPGGRSALVRIAPGGKHWQCATPGPYPTFLYISKKTGRFRLARFDPLPQASLP